MEEREILVSKLYSLRAAISELSIKKDELDGLNLFINNPRAELDREKALIEENKENARLQYEDDCEKELKKIRDLEQANLAAIRKKERKVSSLSFIIFMVGSALLYYYVLKDLPLIYDLGLAAGIIISIGGGMLGWFVLGLISKMLFKHSCNSSSMKTIKQEVNDNNNLYKSKFDKQVALYDEMLMKIENTNIDTKDAIKKRELLVKVSKILTDKTSDLFSSVLDLRDWKYVDLVIYYLETKRADTIKEALQQIDALKQHEELIDTIEKCAADIVRAIEAAAKKLDATLTKGFNEVTASINLFAQQQHEDNKMLLESVNKVANETEFQSALMAKASVSSEYLMQDFNYLRDYTLRENW